ncbi:MAG: nucleoside recognition domain-containing protein [Planctomycetota bacterium]
MLNRIWFWLLLIGVCYAPAKAIVAPVLGIDLATVSPETGEVVPPPSIADMGKEVTTAAIDGAKAAVDLCLSLIGPMVLWLGVMQVAKDAGLVDGLAYLMRPLMRWLFPEVPNGHPAQGAMLMNISANMLNLGNASTSFGLKAMQGLQELNTTEETATNSMATFLAINTSSVTIIPFTIIGLRAAAGSEDPAGPLFGIFLATLCSTCIAVLAVRTLSKLPAFTATAPAPPNAAALATNEEGA